MSDGCRLNCDDGALEYHDPNGTSAIHTHVSVAECPECGEDGDEA